MTRLFLTLLLVFPFFASAEVSSCRLLKKRATTTEALTTNPDLILIGKAERKLMLFSRGRALKQYHVSLGPNPVGTKIKSGDGKTPEGTYFVESKNPQSSFHLALRVSYPNKMDLVRAEKLNVDPGGDIMIHGFPNNVEYNQRATLNHNSSANWTEGCIGLTNSEIEEIFSRIVEDTPIVICP